MRASAADTTPMVVQLIPLVVGKLQETLHMQGGGLEAAERQSEIQVGGHGKFWKLAQPAQARCALPPAVPTLYAMGRDRVLPTADTPPCLPLLAPPPLPQGLLCGMTQVIVQKLSDSDSAKAGVLQYADHIMDALLNVFACRKSSVHEEAMLAVVSTQGGVGGCRCAHKGGRGSKESGRQGKAGGAIVRTKGRVLPMARGLQRLTSCARKLEALLCPAPA